MKIFQRAVDFVLRVWRLSTGYNVPRAAAAMAYFFLLSLFPLLLCVNAVVGSLQLDTVQMLSFLNRVLPRQAVDLIGEYLTHLAAVPPAALLAGIPATLIASSAGLRVLLDTLDELYGHPRQIGLWRIISSVLFSLLFLLTLCLAVVVVLTGDRPLRLLLELLARLFGDSSQVLVQAAAISRLWVWLRYLLLFCFVVVLVLILYRLGLPKEQARRPSVTVTALLSAVALVGASAVFSSIINVSANYSLLYGSLASMIVLLVWLYLCGTILLVGAAVNRAWVERKE